MQYLDDPDLQEKAIHYVQSKRKIKGVGDAIGCGDTTVKDYMETDPLFKTRMLFALKGFSNTNLRDLQEVWNESADVLNPLVVQCFVDYFVRGEVFTERTIMKKPVRDKVTKEIVLDEHGNEVMELERDILKTTTRSCPKEFLRMGMELMEGKFGMPELQRVAPTVLVTFIQHIAQRVELPKETYELLLGEANSFDKVLEQQSMLVKKKK